MSLQPTIKANHYMVSAGHYLATEAGYKVLEAGGNAFDAGVASGIALGVVQPASDSAARPARMAALNVIRACS